MNRNLDWMDLDRFADDGNPHTDDNQSERRPVFREMFTAFKVERAKRVARRHKNALHMLCMGAVLASVGIEGASMLDLAFVALAVVCEVAG